MEHPSFGSKKFFNKMFPIWSEESKMSFRIWKWNNPNRKWNYLSNNIQISDQKTFYKNKKSFPFGLSYIMLGVTPYLLFGLRCSLCVTLICYSLCVSSFMLHVWCYS